jgi:DNA-binding response OmpR family regulator
MNKKTILIVEDESIIALNLKEMLIDLGYNVCGIAKNKCSTLNILESGIVPDLILMDIYLKGKTTGIELSKILKKSIPFVPILFLTANSELTTIKEASSASAYGYLLKPIKERELKANIDLALYKSTSDKKIIEKLHATENTNKTLKKLQEKEESTLTLVTLKYGYVFDLEKRVLYLKENIVKLTAKEQFLLALLVQKRGSVISREQIEHTIWPLEPAGEGAFRSLIFRLRNKLHKDLILNSNNIGYQIAID